MAVVAVLLDASHVVSPRASIADRRVRSGPGDVVLNLFKADSQSMNHSLYSYTSFSNSGAGGCSGVFEEGRNGFRGRVSSKTNAVDYENASDDENGNGYEDDEEVGDEDDFDLEAEMRKRLKELEETRELEKKAVELQNRLDQEYAEGGQISPEIEEEKRLRVRKELEKVAKEQAERRKMAQLMYNLGQKAYGKGNYARAIEFLEAALTIIPPSTLFGGEIQIWLAMAYEANQRHTDCIALYEKLEKLHPSPSIRRQAAELRYIMQAPKLKISREEMVTIPPIGDSFDNYATYWSDQYKDQRRSGSSGDYWGGFLPWKQPVGFEKSKAFWATLTLWLGLVGAALFLQR